jgi:hypothetical protein
MKIGDKVIVKCLNQISFEEEEVYLNQIAIIININNSRFPIELDFVDEDIQYWYETLGKRKFTESELQVI